MKKKLYYFCMFVLFTCCYESYLFGAEEKLSELDNYLDDCKSSLHFDSVFAHRYPPVPLLKRRESLEDIQDGHCKDLRKYAAINCINRKASKSIEDYFRIFVYLDKKYKIREVRKIAGNLYLPDAASFEKQNVELLISATSLSPSGSWKLKFLKIVYDKLLKNEKGSNASMHGVLMPLRQEINKLDMQKKLLKEIRHYKKNK